MTSTTVSPRALHAVIEAAITATGAESGWILRLIGEEFEVVAAAGGEAPGRLVGGRRRIEGTAGYVASANQPAAVRPQRSDEANAGAGGSAGTPSSILAAPCEHDEGTVGVLELVDAPGGSFSYDDVEVATLLAGVAAACLSEQLDDAVPSPDVLAAGLTALANAAPDRYPAVARTVDVLLS